MPATDHGVRAQSVFDVLAEGENDLLHDRLEHIAKKGIEQNDCYTLRASAAGLPKGCALTVPLLSSAGDAHVGVLSILASDDGRHWSDEEKMVVGAAAPMIALYAQRAALKKQVELLQALAPAGMAGATAVAEKVRNISAPFPGPRSRRQTLSPLSLTLPFSPLHRQTASDKEGILIVGLL